MNDLGYALAWLSFQIAFLLVPALGLQALASRRGPVSGAWVATWSLGLVVILGFASCLPRIGPAGRGIVPVTSSAPATATAADSKEEPTASTALGGTPGATGFRPPLFYLFASWKRLSDRAVESVLWTGRWGRAFAFLLLAGTGLGLSRLILGLWAIRLCRRRGTLVDDPLMVELVEELRRKMGCPPSVQILEVSDLATAATAGWRRPMLLLPTDWRWWGESERRAVVAHELAHIIRRDYATGLLAKAAVALNFHHPLVHWMAGRLHLEQELAADAMGAQFAGGRSCYLLALSRLALKQDGRPLSWPARAFLPTRGTLIRRIAMLKNETKSWDTGVSWSRTQRLATIIALLVLAVSAACWKAPARAADEGPSSAPKTGVAGVSETTRPFDVQFLPAKTHGLFAIRPAAIAKQAAMNILTPLFEHELLGDDLTIAAKELGVNTSQPGFVKLRCEDIESIVGAINFGQSSGGVKDPEGRKLHSIEVHGITVRAVAPFDWRAFFRQWNMELTEYREPRGVYYKVKAPKKSMLIYMCSVYLPDDRTIVIDGEDSIKEIIAGKRSTAPAYLHGADWDRASRSLLAVTINNQNDILTKSYDLGRTDDAMVLPLFKGIDRWVFSVANSNDITLRAEGAGRNPQATQTVAQAIAQLTKLGLAAINAAPPAPKREEQANRLAKGLLANLKVNREGQSLVLSSAAFGTFADLASILQAEIAEANGEARTAKAELQKERR